MLATTKGVANVFGVASQGPGLKKAKNNPGFLTAALTALCSRLALALESLLSLQPHLE